MAGRGDAGVPKAVDSGVKLSAHSAADRTLRVKSADVIRPLLPVWPGSLIHRMEPLEFRVGVPSSVDNPWDVFQRCS